MISETTSEEVRNEPTKLTGGWSLFDPNDIYETFELDVFQHFLNSKGTVELELANFKLKTFTLVVRGNLEEDKDAETACVLYHGNLNDMSRPKKITMIKNIYALPGIGSIAKNRLGNTLAEYFGVTKDVND